MNLKLFYSPPKWLGFIAPEYIDDMYHVENRLNEKAYAEAKANALEVGNIHIFENTSGYWLDTKNGGPKGDEVYDWPYKSEIIDGKIILSL